MYQLPGMFSFTIQVDIFLYFGLEFVNIFLKLVLVDAMINYKRCIFSLNDL